MQNLSNATTKIQLNSIPEKKTSKRETFFIFSFSLYLGKAAREATQPEHKKDMKSYSHNPPLPESAFGPPRQKILFSYFCMLLSSLPVALVRLFHLFYLSSQAKFLFFPIAIAGVVFLLLCWMSVRRCRNKSADISLLYWGMEECFVCGVGG